MKHKIVNMLDPQSHHNPQPKRSSSSGTLHMIPPWNIHTVKQSMPRSCSYGCSLNWFTPSEFFKFSQLTNYLVSLKNANDVHKKSSIWSGFEIKNWIEDKFQSSPKLVGIWTVLGCIFVPNLEIVTSISGELWHGQAQNGVNFDFGVQFDLEGQGQGQSPPKTLGILTKVFYTNCPNLVILAWTGVELSCGQASAYRTHRRTDGRTDTQTDRQTQATTIPEGQNWPRVKSGVSTKWYTVLLLGSLVSYSWENAYTKHFLNERLKSE